MAEPIRDERAEKLLAEGLRVAAKLSDLLDAAGHKPLAEAVRLLADRTDRRG